MMWPESQNLLVNEDQQNIIHANEHQNQRNVRTSDMTSDIEKTKELKDSLVSYGVVESESEIHHRMKMLGSLHKLVKQWIHELPLEEDELLVMADTVSGNIYTFGSNRFGIHHSAVDIDALCLTPRHVDRTDYFTSFFELLQSQPQVKNLRAEEDTIVPVLKMDFDGTEIAMLFVKISLKETPDSFDLSDGTQSKSLNLLIQCVRSLDERQVMNKISRLVPNINNFKLTLQAVKLWAKRHGVYSSALGYLGGVSWAILVAHTCQLYPNAAPATLVHKFFLVFSQWKWPQPVLLKHPDNLGFPFWDLRMNISDRFHLMPIITPAHPQQNSALNVCASTRTVIMEEFRLGLAVTDEIMLGKCTWERLFEAPYFFSRYKHFIVLLASSASTDDQLQWCGLVESKIRHLITSLERNPHITLAHVNPECYNSVPLNTNNGQPLALPPGAKLPTNTPAEINRNENGAVTANYCSMWFIGIVFEKTNKTNVDLTHEIVSFTNAINNKAKNTNMLLEVRHVRQKQLAQYVTASLLVSERPMPAKRKHCEVTTELSDAIAKIRRLSESSMGEVTMLSYIEESNSSNKCEVNMQNGTSEIAPGTSGTRVSGETLQRASHHPMHKRSSTKYGGR